MRPRRYLERNRDCVRTDFAPGRPPPVHPRLTGACAAMRGFQICVSGHAQMQRPPSAWPALRPSSRCQTARCAACPRSPSRSRGAFLRPGCASSSLCLHRISAAFAGASAGSRPNPWRQLQLRPRNEGCRRSAGRRTTFVVALVRRDLTLARRARPVQPGRSPLGAPPWRFSARGPLPSPAFPPDPAARLLAAGHRSWRATAPGLSTAVTSRGRRHSPLRLSGSSPETPLMSEDGNRCTIYSLRSQ